MAAHVYGSEHANTHNQASPQKRVLFESDVPLFTSSPDTSFVSPETTTAAAVVVDVLTDMGSPTPNAFAFDDDALEDDHESPELDTDLPVRNFDLDSTADNDDQRSDDDDDQRPSDEALPVRALRWDELEWN